MASPAAPSTPELRPTAANRVAPRAPVSSGDFQLQHGRNCLAVHPSQRLSKLVERLLDVFAAERLNIVGVDNAIEAPSSTAQLRHQAGHGCLEGRARARGIAP